MRRMGVEEELLLVDPRTQAVTAVAQRALRSHAEGQSGPSDVPVVDAELYQQQIELASAPCADADSLRRSLVEARRAVLTAAERAEAWAVAVPAPVLLEQPARVTPKERYRRIVTEYGALARESLVCGMHVHVEVDDDAEAVAVLDAIRPWLPVVLALSANSPFYLGEDTGHASWRSQIWSRWPTTGPREPFESADCYRETSRLLQDWGAALDEGMLYFDARRARALPTVEIRVADVCTEVDDAVLVALLTRALVDAAARKGAGTPPWRADLLRAAQWRAARTGMGGALVHPVRRELAPAREVVEALIEHTSDALESAGDRHRVLALLEQLIARGNGAARQRAVLERTGRLGDVVADLADRTAPR